MMRIIMDTNIYGEIAKEKQIHEFLDRIGTQREFIFYGIRGIIRMEIRNTPSNIKIWNRSLRILLLSLYDSIIKTHELSLNADITFLADRYYDAYRELGGSKSKYLIINDFLIVATASFNNMDILVSNDNYTLLTENSIRAYSLINKTKKLKVPSFINYLEFKRRLFSL